MEWSRVEDADEVNDGDDDETSSNNSSWFQRFCVWFGGWMEMDPFLGNVCC